MANMKEIPVSEFNSNVFNLIGTDWMLITAGTDMNSAYPLVNTMTASWGGMGIMWHKNVAFLVIRPQRYTKEFIDVTDTLSISFFDKSYKEILTYLGTVSGRDEDKISKSGLTIQTIDKTPYFEEASITMLCKKLYSQPMQAACFLDKSLIKKWYPQSDYHEMYIVEISKIFIKE